MKKLLVFGASFAGLFGFGMLLGSIPVIPNIIIITTLLIVLLLVRGVIL